LVRSNFLKPSLIASLLIASAGAVAFCFLTLDRRDAFFGSLLAVAALVVAAVDVERFEIPDLANVLILLAGLTWQVWGHVDDMVAALLRCAVAAGLLLLVRGFYRRWRQVEGLGLGDVKLAGAGAVWLDWSQMWFALAVAAGGAALLVLGRRLGLKEPILHDTALPFGAFLAPAIWIAWIVQMTVS
jgi:leader peptidase (prepilin peptidase)/N-methyltransferase